MPKQETKLPEQDAQLVELTAIYQQLAGLEADDMTTGNQDLISEITDRLHIFIHKHFGVVV